MVLHRRSYDVYLRAGYALPNVPAILCLEYGWSEYHETNSNHKHGEFYLNHFGLSAGYRLTKLIGLEAQVAVRVTTYFYAADGINEVKETYPIPGLAILLFKHDISHFTLGYGLENTWRAGYSIQLGGYK
jgi:hypothetical protein